MSEQEEKEVAEKAAKEVVIKKTTEEEKLKAEEEAKKQKDKDFESWLAKQPEDVRNLYNEHVGGLKSALDKERETNKLNKGALDKLTKLEEAEQKRKEAEMTEIEKVNLRAETAEKELKELKAQKVRREIAEKVGLPVEFADRLRGETPEELEEDAKAFSEKMPKTTPKISTTNPDGSITTGKKTEMELLQEIKSGGAPGIFSLGGNQAQGGGVYYSPGKQGGVVE